MATRQTKWHGRVEGVETPCSVRGCKEAGEFRAPLTPSDFDGPGHWRWLCLEHVREHNARYNFFAGMSPEEIEAACAEIIRRGGRFIWHDSLAAAAADAMARTKSGDLIVLLGAQGMDKGRDKLK